jgi:hypothetical protein
MHSKQKGNLKCMPSYYYVSPSNEVRHIVLVWFFLPLSLLLLLLLSETCLERQNVMARTRKYYLKNNYLTLRSKVKVPWRSLRYATRRPMIMHPHTKYINLILVSLGQMLWVFLPEIHGPSLNFVNICLMVPDLCLCLCATKRIITIYATCECISLSTTYYN